MHNRRIAWCRSVVAAAAAVMAALSLAPAALAAGSGPAYSWGDDTVGDLGIGSPFVTGVPTLALAPARVVQAAVGDAHTLLLLDDGSVLGAGANESGQLGQPLATGSSDNFETIPGIAPATQVAAGTQASFALRRDGSVWAWGDNSHGELGNGTISAPDCNSECDPTPQPVTGVDGDGTLTGVAAISAGPTNAIALLSDGEVVTWGDDTHNELGIANFAPVLCKASPCSPSPIVVSGMGGNGTLTGVTAVSAGGGFDLALRSDGSVWAWGDNSSGELGIAAPYAGSFFPLPVAGVGGNGTLGDVTAIAAGGSHALALRSDGTVVAWGADNVGQLGQGDTTPSNVPVAIPGLSHVVAIAATEFTSYALEADGTLWAWGGDGLGELGATPSGSQPCGTCAATPFEVSAPPLNAVMAIAQGSAAQHAVAIAGPRVAASTSMLAFGTAAPSTLSAPQTVTLTNSGAAPLRLSGLTFNGADPGDFLVGSSTCDGAIAVGASCGLQVFFAPQAPGARSAVLQIQTNDVSSPTDVTLSGTGAALPAAVTGITGATGATGPTGPAGPQGNPGEVELVTCTSSTKIEKVGNRHKKVIVTRCVGRLVSGTLKLTQGSPSVELTRAHVVYARGWEMPVARGRTALALAPVRPLQPGDYTLVVHGTRHGRTTVTQRGIRLVR